MLSYQTLNFGAAKWKLIIDSAWPKTPPPLPFVACHIKRRPQWGLILFLIIETCCDVIKLRIVGTHLEALPAQLFALWNFRREPGGWSCDHESRLSSPGGPPTSCHIHGFFLIFTSFVACVCSGLGSIWGQSLKIYTIYWIRNEWWNI
jgi:hypothetical protein